jgi:preprotein translocase subunit Sec61beta
MNDLLAKMRKAARAGLIQGGAVIMKDAQKRTPLDLGNLKASADIVWQGGPKASPAFKAGGQNQPNSPESANAPGTSTPLTDTGLKMALAAGMIAFHQEADALNATAPDTTVTVGFGAYYAVFVHENPNAKHPIGEYKFLERAMEAKSAEVLELVERKTKAALS